MEIRTSGNQVTVRIELSPNDLQAYIDKLRRRVREIVPATLAGPVRDAQLAAAEESVAKAKRLMADAVAKRHTIRESGDATRLAAIDREIEEARQQLDAAEAVLKAAAEIANERQQTNRDEAERLDGELAMKIRLLAMSERAVAETQLGEVLKPALARWLASSLLESVTTFGGRDAFQAFAEGGA